MKLKGHLFWTFWYLFIIAYFLEPLALVFIFIITFIGTMPDVDSNLFRKYKKEDEKDPLIEMNNPHRWIITHSLLLPGLAFIFYPTILTLLILLAFGHHFFLDVIINTFNGKKRIGYYTICVIPSYSFNFLFFKLTTKAYRLNGRNSSIWLLGNFGLTLIILLMVVLS